MSPTPTVRGGGDADRAFVRDLGLRTVMDSVAAFRAPIPGFVELAFERLLSYTYSQDYQLLIAVDGEQRLGFVLLIVGLPDEATLEPQAFVAYMAVEPAVRRRGIGRALLHEAQEHARRRGLGYMALMVTEENEPARRLYERTGFFTERRLLCKRL